MGVVGSGFSAREQAAAQTGRAMALAGRLTSKVGRLGEAQLEKMRTRISRRERRTRSVDSVDRDAWCAYETRGAQRRSIDPPCRAAPSYPSGQHAAYEGSPSARTSCRLHSSGLVGLAAHCASEGSAPTTRAGRGGGTRQWREAACGQHGHGALKALWRGAMLLNASKLVSTRSPT